MLNSISVQPLVYFCLAALMVAIAVYISPKEGMVKKMLLIKISQKGSVETIFPLITSVVVSFVLTLLLKIFQG